ncbi:MAG: class I SAM-dependent RNA methyltransferase [Rubellimicrobium sp.]|nr:class I SAM-dependent RNA methyltransferase [Rubellimicrobium sp.]
MAETALLAPEGLFLVAVPGLEAVLAEEAAAQGFAAPSVVPGGVTIAGGWDEVWRANLVLRTASRVLVRVGSFRALHLAQLDKRARRFAWGAVLRPDVPVHVEATCHASRIYHAGAAAERVARAIAEELGAPLAGPGEGVVAVKVRIDDDLVTLSIDTSGAGLHKRGFRTEVAKAPLRETLAAAFLRQCGHDGSGPVVDPMCGSGTFVIEAAEIALGLVPGRGRAFAFELLAGFDAARWAGLRDAAAAEAAAATTAEAAAAEIPPGPVRFHGSDRDSGAVAMATRNAARAGVGAVCAFERRAISDLSPPEGPAGLVIVNPPWGTRIGERKALFGLHAAFGQVMRARFAGWRVGIVTPDGGLARATGLPFLPQLPPVAHGGQRLTLWRTGPLPAPGQSV